MSTRGQFLFVAKAGLIRTSNTTSVIEEAQIYRHSDSYPEIVLQDLKNFRRFNEGRNGDVPYLAANFIYFMKRQMEALGEDVLVGYGVESASHRIHGDEQYLYKIDVFPDGRWEVTIADLFSGANFGKEVDFDSAIYSWTGEFDKICEMFDVRKPKVSRIVEPKDILELTQVLKTKPYRKD
ncbi:MAG: hypothetical protein QXL94_04395 [Candidatus Parvarchaeum sp.]